MKIEEREQILSEYKENKELMAKAEKRLAELREEILTQIGPGKHGEWIVLISDQERESFILKEAKANLTEAVLDKISKFIKRISYKVVKVEHL